MPIYEYQCKRCHHITERLVYNDRSPEIKCVNCGYVAEKIMSSSTFQLKGSGWAKDGYAKANK